MQAARTDDEALTALGGMLGDAYAVAHAGGAAMSYEQVMLELSDWLEMS